MHRSKPSFPRNLCSRGPRPVELFRQRNFRMDGRKPQMAVLKELGARQWTGSMRFRLGTSSGLLWMQSWTLRFHKVQGICLATASLLADTKTAVAVGFVQRGNAVAWNQFLRFAWRDWRPVLLWTHVVYGGKVAGGRWREVEHSMAGDLSHRRSSACRNWVNDVCRVIKLANAVTRRQLLRHMRQACSLPSLFRRSAVTVRVGIPKVTWRKTSTSLQPADRNTQYEGHNVTLRRVG